MKKVSVIVPMYKAKPYVKPCVDALLRQGVEEDALEILLIDDRSPDDTFAYAKDLFRDCPAVRVIEQEQNGVTVPSKAAIQFAPIPWNLPSILMLQQLT